MTDVPHFAFPFRFDGGRAVEVEQDSVDDVVACVEAVLRCPLGHRDERPDFGVEDQTFRQGGIDVAALTDAVEEIEPRAAVVLLPDEIVDLAQRVRVEVWTKT